MMQLFMLVASLRDSSGKSIALSMWQCRAPGSMGVAVDTGENRTSLKVSGCVRVWCFSSADSLKHGRALRSSHIVTASSSLPSFSAKRPQLASAVRMV